MCPIRPNAIWAADFQFDQTRDGRTIKILNIIDEFTREALATEIDRSIDADHVVGVLDRVVDAIFYVAATGCQWRALPSSYPNWNTVHRYHLEWSRNGTWERIAARLAAAVREQEGREAELAAGTVDARSVGASSVISKQTKGFDAGKKINGRKTFGIVDTLGLLIAVIVVAARVSDNAGGITVTDRARERSGRFAKLWCDAGFKTTFFAPCRHHHVGVEVVNKIHPRRFEVLPRRWIVERTWSWLMNSRRLQVDYERDPVVTEGFIWAAHSRHLLRRLT
jgi:transposase